MSKKKKKVVKEEKKKKVVVGPPKNVDVLPDLKRMIPPAIFSEVSSANLSVEDRKILSYLVQWRWADDIEELCDPDSAPDFECNCYNCYNGYYSLCAQSAQCDIILQAYDAFNDYINRRNEQIQKNKDSGQYKKNNNKKSGDSKNKMEEEKKKEEENLDQSPGNTEKNLESAAVVAENLGAPAAEEERRHRRSFVLRLIMGLWIFNLRLWDLIFRF